ncbi:hypothetical protein PR048_021528 [Dryococelus australis]|uniref:Uncharacterized protein n=1 Tax=Dryococelus australis TaxID=614101 RepID=A0ABQ9GYH6_9NEOP|nr:hypothetical protein PR048_021528 [Dryococelus australis]
MWESCWTIPLAGGFSRGTQFPPLLHSNTYPSISGDDGHLRVPAGKLVTRGGSKYKWWEVSTTVDGKCGYGGTFLSEVPSVRYQSAADIKEMRRNARGETEKEIECRQGTGDGGGRKREMNKWLPGTATRGGEEGRRADIHYPRSQEEVVFMCWQRVHQRLGGGGGFFQLEGRGGAFFQQERGGAAPTPTLKNHHSGRRTAIRLFRGAEMNCRATDPGPGRAESLGREAGRRERGASRSCSVVNAQAAATQCLLVSIPFGSRTVTKGALCAANPALGASPRRPQRGRANAETRISAGAKVRRKREKARQPTASSGTIPTCESQVTRLGIELGSPWWDASELTAQPLRPRCTETSSGKGKLHKRITNKWSEALSASKQTPPDRPSAQIILRLETRRTRLLSSRHCASKTSRDGGVPSADMPLVFSLWHHGQGEVGP